MENKKSTECADENVEFLNGYRARRGVRPIPMGRDGLPSQRTDQASISAIQYWKSLATETEKLVGEKNAEISNLSSRVRISDKNAEEIVRLENWIREARQGFFLAGEHFKAEFEKDTTNKQAQILWIMMAHLAVRDTFENATMQALRPHAEDFCPSPSTSRVGNRDY